MQNASLCNDQCKMACWPGVWTVGKNFDIASFLDAINVMIVKLFMMVLLIELYLFIQLSVTLAIFQGHRSVKQFYLQILCFLSDLLETS